MCVVAPPVRSSAWPGPVAGQQQSSSYQGRSLTGQLCTHTRAVMNIQQQSCTLCKSEVSPGSGARQSPGRGSSRAERINLIFAPLVVLYFHHLHRSRCSLPAARWRKEEEEEEEGEEDAARHLSPAHSLLLTFTHSPASWPILPCTLFALLHCALKFFFHVT